MDALLKLLIEHKILTKEPIARYLKNNRNKKVTLGGLIEEKLVDADKVWSFFAKELKAGVIAVKDIDGDESINLEKIYEKISGIEYIDLDNVELDTKLTSRVPLNQLKKSRAVPVSEEELSVKVAFADPFDIGSQEAVQRMFPRKPLSVMASSAKQISEYLNKLEISESVKELVSEIRKELSSMGDDEMGDDDETAIVKLIDVIMKNSIIRGSSDIHIEAGEKNCTVRDRRDGMLVESFIFDKDIYAPLSSRLKLMANLDIAERRKPQDGRFSTVVDENPYDFRMSTLPTMHGESIVLRILDKSKALVKLEEAGMSKFCYNRFSEGLKAPYGIMLVTGPTGSGKTTTLYGALNAIRDVKDKVITVEDPVEYQMNLIQQVQVSKKTGLTFASALRSILRQDPDKIMIGEIRDSETLRIAIEAALTGHLVLSTLHTNDSISAITRMLDMGIESYLVSGALIAIEAQRLVRKICPHCKTPVELPQNMFEDIKKHLPQKYKFYKGVGCKECNHSGYAGREMIAEVLTVSETISHMVARNASKEELMQQANKEGFVTMFHDGIVKAAEGVTTVEEIYRVARV
ncbi:MAG: GspE/PulE family protein [Campylobacterota bacterium]